ncbi:MAG: hypothetical protein HEQ39_12345 [Rhizobacter sp.]
MVTSVSADTAAYTYNDVEELDPPAPSPSGRLNSPSLQATNNALTSSDVDSASGVKAPVQIASAASVGKKVLDTLLPDGMFIGYTINPKVQPKVGGVPLFAHGHFLTYAFSDGKFGDYSTKPVLTTPWGGLSVVGTVRPTGQESGLNLSGLIPSPVGNFLWWINFRNNKLTAEGLVQAIQNTKDGKPLVLSMNFGPMYSASDGAFKALLSNPATAGAAVLPALAAEASGANLWIGLGWRGEVTFKDGKIDSLTISGTKIPWSQIGGFLEQKTAQLQKSPSIGPNFGSNAIASFNDTTQAVFGSSPWDIGHAAVKRDGNGSVVMKNGTVDVMNHGNSIVNVTEPVYELGVKNGLLKVDLAMKGGQLVQDVQRIRSNTQAAQIVNSIINAAGKKSPTEYFNTLARLMNPYDINHGSSAMKFAYDSYHSNLGFRFAIDSARERMGMKPLPKFLEPSPADSDFVRDVFSGKQRMRNTTPENSPLNPPRQRVF